MAERLKKGGMEADLKARTLLLNWSQWKVQLYNIFDSRKGADFSFCIFPS